MEKQRKEVPSSIGSTEEGPAVDQGSNEKNQLSNLTRGDTTMDTLQSTIVPTNEVAQLDIPVTGNISPIESLVLTQDEPKPADQAKRYDVEQITLVATSKLVQEDWHPRTGDSSNDQLLTSIKQKGILTSLTVMKRADGKFSVIDGTRILKVAKKLGLDVVPCVVNPLMSDAEAANMAYTINDDREAFTPIEEAKFFKFMLESHDLTHRELEVKVNRSRSHISSRLGLLELSKSVQKNIIKGEITAAHGLALNKLPSEKEQERMAKQIIEHEIPATKTLVRVKRYLSKVNNKIAKELKIQIPSGDVPGVNFKDSKDMCELPNDSVQLVVTSPPYNVNKPFELNVPHAVHLDEVKGVCKEIARVLVPGGIVALNVDNINCFKGADGKSKQSRVELMGHKYQQFFRKYNITLTDVIIWEKEKNWDSNGQVQFNEDTVHTSYRLLPHYESIYIFRKKGARELPPEDVILKSKLTKEQWVAWSPGVWKIPSVWKQNVHPTQYPDELCYRLIKMFSYEGDTVLDPWLGSGTTVKVARELNRNGIGYERELKYKPVIMQKLGMEVPEVQDGVQSMSEFGTKTLAEVEDVKADTPKPKAEFFTNAPKGADGVEIQAAA